MREAFIAVWRNPYVRVATFLLGLYVLYAFLIRAGQVLVVFAAAYALAYLANPLIVALERRRLPRGLGVLVVYILGFLFLGLASVLVYQVFLQLSSFVQDIPSLAERVLGWAKGAPGWLERWLKPYGLEAPLSEAVTKASQGLGALLQNITGTLLGWIEALVAGGKGLVQGLAAIVGGIFQLVLVFLVAAYLMLDFPKVGRTLIEAFPRPYQPFVKDLARNVDRAVGGFVRGQLVVAALVGTVVGVGLWVLGVPLAASLGFIAGVFNLVPYLGVVISIVPAVLLAAAKGWPFVLGTVAVFVLANQLEAQVFSPLILGRATQLHPVTVILSILTGGVLFGLWGALLAVPAVAFLKLVMSEYYTKSDFYNKG